VAAAKLNQAAPDADKITICVPTNEAFQGSAELINGYTSLEKADVRFSGATKMVAIGSGKDEYLRRA
jgi:hypothetical protein